jgi:osmotically inducible protein OsmC
MPRIERTAEIVWKGNVARGEGTISAGSGAFSGLAYSLAARIGQLEGKTSPEELLAAAHGGCLTMSLASELVSASTPPGRLVASCRIVMDEVEGQGHQIVASHVELVAAAEGLDGAGLEAAVAKADEGCPFSTLLRRAGADVRVTARLGSDSVYAPDLPG